MPTRGTRFFGFQEGKMGVEFMPLSSLRVCVTPFVCVWGGGGSGYIVCDVIGGKLGCGNVCLCKMCMTY